MNSLSALFSLSSTHLPDKSCSTTRTLTHSASYVTAAGLNITYLLHNLTMGEYNTAAISNIYLLYPPSERSERRDIL